LRVQHRPAADPFLWNGVVPDRWRSGLFRC